MIGVWPVLADGVPTLAAEPPSPAASPAPPSPNCANRQPPYWVTGASSPNDGVPDPAGRIVFGELTRVDDVLGQLVRLFAIDPDGSDLVQLLDCETARPRISPDGTRIAFAIAMDDGHDRVATMAIDGSDLRILTTSGYSEYPDWSPDGSWLIYAHSDQECSNSDCLQAQGVRESLWRMNADGSNQRRIGPADVVDQEPRLSPDGSQVVFSRSDPPAFQTATIMIRDLATGEERVATSHGRGEEHPDWSPDGKWIIYNTFDSASHPYLFQQIERVPSDDATATPVVLYPGDATHDGWKATYSPDGSSIAFDCNEALCRMDADGSNVQVLVTAPGDELRELNHVAWGVVPKTPA